MSEAPHCQYCRSADPYRCQEIKEDEHAKDCDKDFDYQSSCPCLCHSAESYKERSKEEQYHILQIRRRGKGVDHVVVEDKQYVVCSQPEAVYAYIVIARPDVDPLVALGEAIQNQLIMLRGLGIAVALKQIIIEVRNLSDFVLRFIFDQCQLQRLGFTIDVSGNLRTISPEAGHGTED